MRKDFSPSRPLSMEAVVKTNLQGVNILDQVCLIIRLWKCRWHIYLKSCRPANQPNIIIINNFQRQRLMFRQCWFCICWIWIWIYFGYWVELGNFQIWNDSHNNCHCSVLQNSTDELCPAILYLWPFRWKFPPGKGGWQVSLSMLSYIHVFLSPSNLTSMISKESEMSHEKKSDGGGSQPCWSRSWPHRAAN